MSKKLKKVPCEPRSYMSFCPNCERLIIHDERVGLVKCDKCKEKYEVY